MNIENELAVWYTLQEQLAALKERELTLRRAIFAAAFPMPVEGTNTYSLPNGWVLKGKMSINRKVDLAAYIQLLPKLREASIPVDSLVQFKPELSVSAYRALQEDEIKLHLFDQVLIIKPSETPALEVVLPKKPGRK